MSFIKLLLLFSNYATYCSCIPISLKEEVHQSALIFQGTVLSIEKISTIDDYQLKKYHSKKKQFENSYENNLVKILATHFYKGSIQTDTVNIITGNGGGDCGYPFIQSQEYLIYSSLSKMTILEQEFKDGKVKYYSKDSKNYQTNICRRTTLRIDSEKPLLIDFLNKSEFGK